VFMVVLLARSVVAWARLCADTMPIRSRTPTARNFAARERAPAASTRPRPRTCCTYLLHAIANANDRGAVPTAALLQHVTQVLHRRTARRRRRLNQVRARDRGPGLARVGRGLGGQAPGPSSSGRNLPRAIPSAIPGALRFPWCLITC
jgi:hypothetical protein